MFRRAFHSAPSAAPEGSGPTGRGARDASAAQPAQRDDRLPAPSSPRDTPRRRERDAALRSMDEQIAEALEQSRRMGELSSARSYGKPMAEMEGWAETPAEFRLPFKILKNADAHPPEVAMFRERGQLRDAVAACADPEQRRKLEQRLSELEQAIAMRLEHMRVTGSL